MITILIIIAIRKMISKWSTKINHLKVSLLKGLSLIIVIALSFNKGYCQIQNTVFECVRKGEKIGELYAQQTINGNYTNLKVSTSVKTRFIFEVSVETSAQTSFRNELMIDADYSKNVNGTEKLNNLILQKGNGYVMINKAADSIYKVGLISKTGISLYFKEPINVKSVFSEMFLHYVPVTCIAPGKYKVNMPDGSENYYTYSNGTLVQVEINTTFFTVTFILKSISQKPNLISKKL